MQEVLVRGVEVFFLVFIRMVGLFVIAPIFGRRNIPTYFKIGFSLLITIVIINAVKITNEIDYTGFIGYTYLIFVEFIIGILIGFIAYLVFTAIYLAGQLIDMQIGFGVVNVIDPMSNIQIPITANFYTIITTLMFLTINGHHILIKAMYDSYKYVPIGGLNISTKIVEKFVGIYAEIFSLGFRIAAPITAAILIADIALGIISKAMPQLNIFILGMPLKILMGIAIIIITMSAYVTIINILLDSISKNTYEILREMAYKI